MARSRRALVAQVPRKSPLMRGSAAALSQNARAAGCAASHDTRSAGMEGTGVNSRVGNSTPRSDA